MTNRSIPIPGAAVAAALAFAASAPAGSTLEVPGPLDLSLQEGIDIAESLGATQINIAPGVYAESVRLPANGYNLVLMGDPADPGAVVIDPSAAIPPINDSAVHVLGGQTAATQLVGLTLTGGNADGVDDGDGAAGADERGGGLYLNASSATVVDCILTGNVASGTGGSFYSNGGTVSFTRCVLGDSQASTGGAAYTNVSSVTFTDCAFTGNDALVANGGAISVHNGPGVTLLRCRIEGNTSGTDGGGLWTNAPTTILACTILGNDAGGNGGGIYVNELTTTVRDSVVNGNTADTGGAAYAGSGTTLVLVNATLAHNVGTVAGPAGPGAKTIRNGIIWGNAGTAVGTPATVTHTLVQGGFAGAGNISVNPLFVNATGADLTAGTGDDDLRLQPGSPAIDAANATFVIGEYPLDLDGNPRAVDDPATANTGIAVLALAVDMGAYEFQPTSPPPSCPGDLNGDDQVNVVDFLGLLNAWGPCP
jgi:hypothetical protein